MLTFLPIEQINELGIFLSDNRLPGQVFLPGVEKRIVMLEIIVFLIQQNLHRHIPPHHHLLHMGQFPKLRQALVGQRFAGQVGHIGVCGAVFQSDGERALITASRSRAKADADRGTDGTEKHQRGQKSAAHLPAGIEPQHPAGDQL